MAFRISDRERKRSSVSRRTKVDLLCFAVIILVATVFYLSSGSEENLNWDDTRLLLTVTEGTTYAIPYDQITGISLVENPDFGVCLSGENAKNRCSGVWENDRLGSYVLYAYPGASPVIQISTAQEDYWIALDNSETTAAFYKAFVTMLADAGYQIG